MRAIKSEDPDRRAAGWELSSVSVVLGKARDPGDRVPRDGGEEGGHSEAVEGDRAAGAVVIHEPGWRWVAAEVDEEDPELHGRGERLALG